MEFSRDRKSMSVYCEEKETGSPKMFVKGAPESILDRCKYVRINGEKRVDLTDTMKQQILDLVREYGTGEPYMYNMCICSASL